MPATAARIGFVTQPFRLSIEGPVTAIDDAHGKLARDVDPESPMETYFVSQADGAAMAAERRTLLCAERRRWAVALPEGATTVLSLDSATVLPVARVIDDDGLADVNAVFMGYRVDLSTDAVSLEVWG